MLICRLSNAKTLNFLHYAAHDLHGRDTLSISLVFVSSLPWLARVAPLCPLAVRLPPPLLFEGFNRSVLFKKKHSACSSSLEICFSLISSSAENEPKKRLAKFSSVQSLCVLRSQSVLPALLPFLLLAVSLMRALTAALGSLLVLLLLSLLPASC